MSFYTSKRSNLIVAHGKENMPLVDDPSSPPPMTKEDDACLPSQRPPTQVPPACEPNMEMDNDEYSDSDSRSDDTLSPEEDDPYDITTSSQKRLLEGEMETIGDEDEDAEQSPIPIQDHAPGNEEDNTIPSSYDDDDGDDSFSSYDDDPPQESRSGSRYPIPAPSTPRPRPRSPDEDTEMPLSSPTRVEDPTSAYGEGDDDDDDAHSSQGSVQMDFTSDRSSSSPPFEDEPSLESILDRSREQLEKMSDDQAYEHRLQQDFYSSPRQSDDE